MTRIALFSLLLAALPSCASIVSKSTYPVTIDSNPPGASLAVTTSKGIAVAAGPAPLRLSLDAATGYASPATYLIEASDAEGNVVNDRLKAKVDPWYFGNVLFGLAGLLGLVIIDPASGSMYRLDGSHVVIMPGAIDPPEPKKEKKKKGYFKD